MTLEQKMLAHGYRIRMVPITRLKDLKQDIEENFSHGNVDENLQKWLESFYQFDQPFFGGEFSSIAIVASKSPQVRTIFHWKGKGHILTMPPTYLDFISEPKRIKECLEAAASDGKYRFEIADNLPNKLLAVRSGLGRYGRNNLCYIPGMGSYILLTAFYSDKTVNEDHWESLQQMPACSQCRACVKICPGAALQESRFAIHAESCLTYHNEFWGKTEFPEWILPDMHNCLVGCMKCQTVCPENRTCLGTLEGTEEFDEEETEAILGKQPYEELPAGLVMKLERINLHVHYGYLSRNLKALVDNSK